MKAYEPPTRRIFPGLIMSTTEQNQTIAKLPEVITHILRENNVAVPYAWAAGIHADSMHEEPRIQMFQCARQWSAILSVSEEDTRFARYCLASAPTVKIWLQSFTTLVVPLYLKLLQRFAAEQGVSLPESNTTAEVVNIAI
jgi:hypothetical protein